MNKNKRAAILFWIAVITPFVVVVWTATTDHQKTVTRKIECNEAGGRLIATVEGYHCMKEELFIK